MAKSKLKKPKQSRRLNHKPTDPALISVLISSLVVTNHFIYKFYEISAFLTGMAERFVGMKFRAKLPDYFVKRIILAAGGSFHRTNQEVCWNIAPAFDLYPTVLRAPLPKRKLFKRTFLKRKRNPEKDILALAIFNKLMENGK